MIKKFLAALLVVTGLSATSISEEIAQFQFGTLNSYDSPLIIPNNKAQDLLNVEISPGGTSVKKREGYALYKSVGGSTAMRGAHHFYDATGNNVQLWGSNTSLYGSVADAAFTQLVSSATSNATWQCTDSLGYAYCVTSSRDALIKTNGSSISWYTSPLGSIVEMTPTRLAVSGVSANPNRIYLSQSATFTNFTVGLLSTDPYTVDIAAPGSRITHLRYAFGRLLWFKEKSCGFLIGDDQYGVQNVIISNTIGTLDNTSTYYNEQVFFRAQNGHIYSYDGQNLVKLSRDITDYVDNSANRIANSWTQTSQSDFEAGVSTPTGHISFTVSPGDVTVSSFSRTDTATSDFSSGTSSNTTVSNNSVYLATNNSGNITNNDFESAFTGNWTNSGSAPYTISRAANADFTYACSATASPQNGSWLAVVSPPQAGFTATFSAIDSNGSTLATTNIPTSSNCEWVQTSLSSSGNTGKRVKFRFSISGSNNLTTTDSYIWGGDVAFYYWTGLADGSGGNYRVALDNIQLGSSTITSGSFTSQAFDTGISSYGYVYPTAGWTVDNSTPQFTLQSSTATTGPWTTITTSTGSHSAYTGRYLRYVSTFTLSTGNALTSLDDVTLLVRSSGTFYSAVKNASNLTAWDTFNVTKQDNGGSHTFYIRSSTSSFTVRSATPTWVAQSLGGVVSASTGTYFQVRDDFLITKATHTPTINEFTVNWYEGSATDQSYSIYHEDSIWFSVAYGAGQSLNNYIFRYDLLNQGWTLYDIPANGFLVMNNNLYFGSTSTNKVYKFGDGVTADEGSSINAYWNSKDYSGQDPFLVNAYTNIDSFLKKDQNNSITVTYTLNGVSSSSYSVSTSTTTANAIRHNKLLPNTSNGNTISIKYSDTSTTSTFEVLGFRLKYNPKPYSPS